MRGFLIGTPGDSNIFDMDLKRVHAVFEEGIEDS